MTGSWRGGGRDRPLIPGGRPLQPSATGDFSVISQGLEPASQRLELPGRGRREDGEGGGQGRKEEALLGGRWPWNQEVWVEVPTVLMRVRVPVVPFC